jgi:YidC/Oxa1 family membrane protein insertase
MFSAEINRVLLLLGMGVTGYLMILAWDKDYIQSDTDREYTPIAAPAPTADAFTQPVVPGSVVDSGETGVSDVPDASLIVGAQPAQSTSTNEPAQTDVMDRLIHVKTPRVAVWIDRLGGDIVRAELPEFPFDIDRPDVAYTLLNNGNGHIYMAQSGLIGDDGVDGRGERPLYRSQTDSYELEDGELAVSMVASKDGLQVTKTFTFVSDEYLVDVDFAVRNDNARTIQASMFSQIKRDRKDPIGASGWTMGPTPYLGAALTTSEERYEKIEFDDLDEAPYKSTEQGGWIAFLQHYFLSAWVANPDEENLFFGQQRADGTYTVGFTGPLQEVQPGAIGQWHSRFYVGPKDQKRLEEIAPNLNLTVDYGFLWWIAVPLFSILDAVHGLVNNWGVAIILLTVLVKAVLYPLSAASYRSMANMRRVAPQLKRIQERFADDRQKLSQEMMGLYKKEKVNPLGGCLPMLLPMPIFIALYWVLFESVELRHAPFIFWIDDLAAKDPLFVLPLLMGASMYLQQLLSPAVGDPMQVRMMKLMPVMFTALFLFFPAGLVLYWLVNSVLSIAQQWFVMKQTDAAYARKD